MNLLLLHIIGASLFVLLAPISLFLPKRILSTVAIGTGSLTVLSGLGILVTTRADLTATCGRGVVLVLISALLFAVVRKRATVNA